MVLKGPVWVFLGLLSVCVAFTPTPTTAIIITPPRGASPWNGSVARATFSEFDRTGKTRCAKGSLLANKLCWTDSKGVSFHYGCRENDARIFSASCGTNNSNCDKPCPGDWLWGGELQQTCYDDGSTLYQFRCEKSTKLDDIDPTEPPAKENPKPQTCSQLGWPLEPGTDAVCAASKVRNGDCSGNVTYVAAEAMCAKIGARLCTAGELEGDETKGTGCKLDCAAVWSSETCDAGHMTVAGSKKCSSSVETACSGDESSFPVRCCADAKLAPTVAPKVVDLPDEFYPVQSSDYLKGSSCTGKATSTYSCVTLNGSSERMACKNDSEFIWFQDCGDDETCDPSKCTGPWKKSGEIAGRCYAAPKPDNFLYQYSCNRS